MASIPRPIKPLIAPIFGVVFCFCAIFTYVLIDARNAAYDHAADVAASLATAIEADISRNMETVDLSLQSVVDNLKLPGIERLDPKIRNLILFDRSATARYLGRLVVLDEQGKVRFDANTLAPPPTNFADRDYFQAQKNSSDAGLFISRPLVSRLSGNWIVAVSRRLSHPDGSFAGVAGASLQLSHFSQLFKGIALWPDGNVTLSRTDGIVLMRWPLQAAIYRPRSARRQTVRATGAFAHWTLRDLFGDRRLAPPCGLQPDRQLAAGNRRRPEHGGYLPALE